MSDIRVRVGQKNTIKVVSSIGGESILTLSELLDINAYPENLQNGMVLVYNADSQKWDATLDLTPGNVQNLDINGGNF